MSKSVLVAHHVSVEAEVRPHGMDILPPTSLEVLSGSSVLVVGDPGSSHVALALALAGRLSGMSGLVTIDQHSDPGFLQRSVALVDVPGVSEPDPGLPVRTVVGEELAMAGRHAGPRSVRAWLDAAGLGHAQHARLRELTGPQRIRMMVTLAALREPKFMVLTLPERLGGLPEDWVEPIAEAIESGIGMVITASRGLAAHFPDTVARTDRHVEVGNAEVDPNNVEESK